MSPRMRHAGERAGDADDDGDGANGDASSVLSPFLSRPRRVFPGVSRPSAVRSRRPCDGRAPSAAGFAKVETEREGVRKEGARALLFFRAVGAVALRKCGSHLPRALSPPPAKIKKGNEKKYSGEKKERAALPSPRAAQNQNVALLPALQRHRRAARRALGRCDAQRRAYAACIAANSGGGEASSSSTLDLFLDLLFPPPARRARLRLPRHHAPRVPLAEVRPGAGCCVRGVRLGRKKVEGQRAQLRARGRSDALGSPESKAVPFPPAAAPAEARASASESEQLAALKRERETFILVLL